MLTPQCRATSDSQISLTCIGPMSTVALVLPLTRPRRPPSTLSRITSMAGGRRCACAAAKMQLSITLPALPGWLTVMPTG